MAKHNRGSRIIQSNFRPGSPPAWLLYLLATIASLLPFVPSFPYFTSFYLGNPSCDIAQYRSHLTFAYNTLKSGEMPLWCPSTFCGTIFFPSTHATMFSPINFPLLFLLPQPLSVNLAILANAVLLGTGTAWYLRRSGCSAVPCIVGAALAVGGGAFIARVFAGHFTIMSAFSWFPWVYGRFEGLLRFPSWRNAALFAAVAALMYFGGHSQYAYYTALLLGARLVYELAAQRRNLRQFANVRLLVLLGAASLLAAALAAIELAPVLHAVRHSARSGAGGEEWARFFAFPPEALVNLLSPGGLGIHPNYYGRWYWWEVAPYFGVAALAFAVADMGLQVRDRQLSPISVLFALCILLALAIHIPGLRHALTIIPGWSLFRGHTKLTTFAGWFGCILAMSCLNRLRQPDGATRKYCVLATGTIAALTVAGVLLVLSGWPVRFFHSETILTERLHSQKTGVEADAAMITTLLRYWGIAAVLALAAVVLTLKVHTHRIARWGLAGLLVIDLLIFAYPALQRKLPAQTYDAPILFWQFAAGMAETDRVDAMNTYYESQSFGARTVAGQDINISRYFNTYAAALLGDSPDFPQLTFGIVQDNPLLDLANVSYIALPDHAQPGRRATLRPERSFGRWNVFRRPSSLPRAYVINASVTCPNDEFSIHTALTSGGIDFRNQVLLTGSGAEETATTETHSFIPTTAKYTGTSHITVEAPATGWLVLSESYYPLWHATMDKQPREIVRANGGFRAVKVRAGETVEFQFKHPVFTIAAVVSICSWIGLFGCLLFARRRAGL